MSDDVVSSVVEGLSILIMRTRQTLESERSGPGADPDRSDDRIKNCQTRIKALCKLREEFEQEMGGSL